MCITVERLKEVLRYEPLTGDFIWIKRLNSRSTPGKVAGRLDSHGYIQIMIDKKLYFSHRLAFLYVNGYFPPQHLCVDHVNGVRTDNRWENLRIVTWSLNQQNRHHVRKNSKSKLIGAFWCKGSGKWRSCLTINGSRVELGRFDTAEQAHAAYVEAKSKLRD